MNKDRVLPSYCMQLRKYRGKKSRADVAGDLGIPVQSLAKYENGFRRPSPEMMKRFAEYYGKTVQTIFFAE